MSKLAAHAYPVDEEADDDLPALTQHRGQYGYFCGATGVVRR